MIKCEYIDHMGDDLRVVNAARVSMNKESKWECRLFDYEGDAEVFATATGGKIDYDYVSSDRWYGGYPVTFISEQDEKLIKYLAEHNHWTPFSHCIITVRETVPIFVARQRFKHTVGFTYNEISRRYVDDEPEFYIPDAWRKRAENVKQGSSDETVNFEEVPSWWVNDFEIFEPEVLMDVCLNYYNHLISEGVAPEQARMVLPQSIMTSYYCTGSLAAFARAYNLRSDDHAQKEIRDLAGQWDEIIGKLFPISWKELTNV